VIHLGTLRVTVGESVVLEALEADWEAMDGNAVAQDR